MRPQTFSNAELLATARRLFLRDGLNATTSQIAQDLGVSQAAVFKRFATKEELMINALAPDEAHQWIETIKRCPDERPVREQLIALFQEMDSSFATIMPAYSLLRAARLGPETLNKAFPSGAPPVVAHRELVRLFEELHENGRIFSPRPAATASALMGALHGRQQLKLVLGEFAPDPGCDYATALVDLFWRGLAPSGGDIPEPESSNDEFQTT